MFFLSPNLDMIGFEPYFLFGYMKNCCWACGGTVENQTSLGSILFVYLPWPISILPVVPVSLGLQWMLFWAEKNFFLSCFAGGIQMGFMFINMTLFFFLKKITINYISVCLHYYIFLTLTGNKVKVWNSSLKISIWLLLKEPRVLNHNCLGCIGLYEFLIWKNFFMN